MTLPEAIPVEVLNMSEDQCCSVQPLSATGRQKVNRWLNWLWHWAPTSSPCQEERSSWSERQARDITTEVTLHLPHNPVALGIFPSAFLFMISIWLHACSSRIRQGHTQPGFCPAHHMASQTHGNFISGQQATNKSWAPDTHCNCKAILNQIPTHHQWPV